MVKGVDGKPAGDDAADQLDWLSGLESERDADRPYDA